MLSIDLSETAHFVYWKSETMSETNFFSDNFFSDKFFSQQKIFFLDFVSDWILFRTEFCLALHTAVVFRMQSFNMFGPTHMYQIHTCTYNIYL